MANGSEGISKNTKALIKSTLLGLLGGGAVAAIAGGDYSSDKPSGSKAIDNEIIVPLSRKHFMKVVRQRAAAKNTETAAEENKKDTPKKPSFKIPNVAKMMPKDLAALKKSILLGKAASAKQKKVLKTEAACDDGLEVRAPKMVGSPLCRDEKGRFYGTKQAENPFFGPEARSQRNEILGAGAGAIAGITLTKMLLDRIAINRERAEVSRRQKIYADALAKEVDDEDVPYLQAKKASSDDRSLFDKVTGTAAATMLGATALSGLVTYRIMENRRIKEEKDMDRDMGRFPTEKSIRFMFTKDDGSKKKRLLQNRS